MGKERRGREGREGNGSMHPLGFSKVGAYVDMLSFCSRRIASNGNRRARYVVVGS